MGRKPKQSKEIKLITIEQYHSGTKTVGEIAEDLNVSQITIYSWIKKFESFGESTFDYFKKNSSYTAEFKLQVINAYLNGEGSYSDLAIKYQIPSYSTLKRWVIKYNRDIKIKDYNPKGYVYIAKSRKVSYEEKLEIIKWTINNGLEYKLATEKFETSYAQVYNWVKKYNEFGEDGLIDNRGKRKDLEDLTEVEKLNVRLSF
ncbi:TPA: transposase [bacterium]|nr:transposase [bacterium]